MAGWRLGDADWNSWPAGRDDAATWRRAARLGLAGVEVGVYDPDVELAPERQRRRAELAAETGVGVSAVLLSLPSERWPDGALTGSPDRVARAAGACAAAAAGWGLPLVGLWPGADGPDADWGAVVDAAALVAEAVGAAGVGLAVEPKPGTVLPGAVSVRRLHRAVPAVRVLLDTGHSWAGGTDPADEVRRLADEGLLAHLHLGDARPGREDDDLPLGAVHDPGPLLRALDEVGWSGAASFDLYGAALAVAGSGGEDPVEASLRAVGAVRAEQDERETRGSAR